MVILYTRLHVHPSSQQLNFTYLGISIVLKLPPDKGIKGVPVGVDDVTPDGPDVTEDKDGTDEGVQFSRICLHVWTSFLEEQALVEFAQGHHFADVNLGTNRTQSVKQAGSIVSSFSNTISRKATTHCHIAGSILKHTGTCCMACTHFLLINLRPFSTYVVNNSMM